MLKKIFLLAILSGCISFVSAQSQFRFTPKWKVGEKKTVHIEQRETELKKGVLTDTTHKMTASVSVLSETPGAYNLQVLYENIVMRTAATLYEKMGEELPQYNNLDLRYSIDKNTGKADLVNWKEAQEFIRGSFDKINELLKTKTPELAQYTGTIFAPIMNMFESKENIESYLKDEIGYLLFPYDKTFVPGDTLRINEKCANPFNPSDTINQLTLAWLAHINNATKTCEIHSKDILDLDAFKKMMLTMMEKMSKAFGAEDSSQAKAAKEIESIDFSVTNESVISFDYNTTWPTHVVKTGKVVVSNPSDKMEKTVVTTVSID